MLAGTSHRRQLTQLGRPLTAPPSLTHHNQHEHERGRQHVHAGQQAGQQQLQVQGRVGHSLSTNRVWAWRGVACDVV